MYIPALVKESGAGPNSEPSGSPKHYWCNCTLSETGPDDKQVGPQSCQAGRNCFNE